MNAKQKQEIKKSLLAAASYLANAQAQLRDAASIAEKEIEQLYIGRILTHQKGASPEMFDLSEEKSCISGMIEQMSKYAEQLYLMSTKHN